MADGSSGSRTDPARVKEIFIAALDQPEAERGAYLDSACGNDAALRHEVEGLLAAHAEPPVLEAATLASGRSKGLQGHGEGPGTRIGPYKLLQLIGEGGFGAVFMAEQEEPVRRRVALKIIKLGMDTRQVVARFEQERQALALMDHPNIAKVLDAGATATGRPYFVMELVKGVTITTYCDEQNLSPPERLELFTSVCHAVQHAHQKGIIHRDIKPTNVLVSRHDDRPVVKVIDFGIAKATNARLTEKTVFTELRQMIGTPAYMSPEQAGLSDLDIDTRSDIYSLGVLLYELLTGTTPFDSKRLRSAAYGEIQRIIREEEPPKPSTRLSTMGDSLPSVAALRKTEPAKLRKLVRGDLDWIVMKCLEKDRTRRYETANGLAMEVQRYLAGEPVVAAPPSAAYRLRKFVRRNQRSALAAGLMGAVLVLGIVGTTWGMLRAEARRREAEQARAAEAHQRAVADQARERAEAINEFVNTALVSSDPNQGGKQDTLVADAMLKALKELDAGAFKADPETEARLRDTIATILDGNGRTADAEPLFAHVLEMNQRFFKGDHAEVAKSLNMLGLARRSMGRAAEAEPLFVQSLEMYQRLYKGDHPEIARGLNNLALVRQDVGRVTEAEPLLVQALEMSQRLSKGDDANVAQGLENLALCIQSLGRAAEALPKYEAALAMYQRLHPGDHPRVAMCTNSVANCFLALGRAGEALPRYEAALAMRRRLFKGDHQDVAEGLNNLANCLRSLGRAADALLRLEEALAMWQRLYKGDHPSVAIGLNNVAGCLLTLDRANEALPKFEAALAMRQRLYDGDHPDVALSLNNVALCLQNLGRAAEALPKCQASLEMDQRIYKGDHPEMAKALQNVGSCLRTLGRAGEALPKFEAALAMRRKMLPPGHNDIRASEVGLGRTLTALARYAEAEPLITGAYSALADRATVPARLKKQTLEGLVELYEARAKAEPGEGYDAKAVEWRAKLAAWQATTQPARKDISATQKAGSDQRR